MITFTKTAERILRVFHRRGYDHQAITVRGDEIVVTVEGDCARNGEYDVIEHKAATLTEAARKCERQWFAEKQEGI